MHSPDLYQQCNTLQMRDAVACLEKYASKMQWNKKYNRIMDIGCGDGSTTSLLEKYLKTDFKLIGTDISENMVNFANNWHQNLQTSFTVLDIKGDLPEDMKGSFDHVFSFYTLHWAKDQKQAFKNIFQLLDEDGKCLMIFLAYSPVHEYYRLSSQKSKWSRFLHDVEKYMPPNYDSKDPAKEITELMTSIGFVDIDVECEDKDFLYENMDLMKTHFAAINPFNIPKYMQDEFYDNYLQLLKDIELAHNDKNSPHSVRFYYKLLKVYGRKPLNTTL